MDKIAKTAKNIAELDYKLMDAAQVRLNNLTKPQGSLGKLEELAKLIVGITRKANPGFKNKVVFTLSADHGVTEEGISAYPKEVTPQMVYNFIRGGAGINVLARHVGARVIVVDMGIAEEINPCLSVRQAKSKIQNFLNKKISYGTTNFTKGPAMTKEKAVRAIETGIDLINEEAKKGIDIVGTGDMGIGNTTSSSAIAAVITGKPVKELCGRGTGIDKAALKHKIAVINYAIKLNKPDSSDAIDVLSKVGGFEIGGLAGIIVGCAAKRIPVVIDGFISGAASLLAYKIEPKVIKYCIASHRSQEPGHKIILDYLGLLPLFDLSLRLGEGTGACLGINLVEASLKVMEQMATFESAKVSEKIS